MLYNIFQQIDKYEIMDFFITGIDIGILTIDDLSEYIFEQIEKSDLPDVMYCDIALQLSKDWKILRALIMQYLSYYGYVYYASEERESIAYHLSIYIIGERYKNEIITLKQITHLFYKLSVIYDSYSELNVLEDYYDLAEQGVYKDLTEIEKRVMDILEENKEYLDERIHRR